MLSDKLPKEKILEILRKVEDTDNVELLDCKIGSGSEKGDNYSGILLACNITAKVNKEEKKYSWMVKVPSEDQNRAQMSRLMRSDEKEADMYGRVIPAWRQLIKERKAEGIKLNFCKVYHAEYHQDINLGSTLVMENMKKLGYGDAVNKKKGLHLGYAKLMVEELAKFHALGYAYMKSYPGGIAEGLKQNELLARDFFMAQPDEKMKPMMDQFTDSLIKSMVTLLNLVQEPGQDFAGAFERFHKEKGAFKYRDQLAEINPNGFNTLIHGDAWFSNCMFKHETMSDGSLKPSEAYLIDLAMPRWSNPCIDLAYFLFLSTTPQLRRTHYQDILGHYHDTLVHCLHLLGEDPAIYPYREFVKDYERISYVGFIMAMMILPLMICKKEDAVDLDFGGDFEDKEAMKKQAKNFTDNMEKAFANEPQIKLIMGGNFLEMVDRGFFKL